MNLLEHCQTREPSRVLSLALPGVGRIHHFLPRRLPRLWDAVDPARAIRGREVTASGSKPDVTNRSVCIDNGSIFHSTLDSPTTKLVLLESVTWPPYRPFPCPGFRKTLQTPCSWRAMEFFMLWLLLSGVTDPYCHSHHPQS